MFLKAAGCGYPKIMSRDLDHNLPAGLTMKIFPDGLKTAKSALSGVGNKPLKVILRGLILKATHGFLTLAAIGMNQATLDTSHDTMTFLGGIKNVIVMTKIGDGHLNDDGILEWQAPDGTIWGEVQGIWLPLDDDLDSVEDSAASYTWAGDLLDGPTLVSIYLIKQLHSLLLSQLLHLLRHQHQSLLRVTPTPIPDYVAAYIYTDPSCSSLYVGWEPGGGSQLEPEQWHIEIEVDSYLGLAVIDETFPTPI